jgi:hypothetical protein
MTPLECAVHDQNLLNKAENMLRESFDKATSKFQEQTIANKKGTLTPTFKKAIPKLMVPKGVLAHFDYMPEDGLRYGSMSIRLVLENKLGTVNGRSFPVGSIRGGVFFPAECERNLEDQMTAKKLLDLKDEKRSLFKKLNEIDLEIASYGVNDRLIHS